MCENEMKKATIFLRNTRLICVLYICQVLIYRTGSMIDWVCVIFINLHFSDWLNYTYEPVYNETTSSVDQYGLSYLAINAILLSKGLNNVAEFCQSCHSTPSAPNCDICSKTLSIYRKIAKDDTSNLFKLYQWTDAELAARVIPKPNFITCSDAQTLCTPGPCSVFDYNYLAQWYIDEDGKVQASTDMYNELRQLIMFGNVQCVPLFGIQTVTDLTLQSPQPEFVDQTTMNVFPSRTTNLEHLYDPVRKTPNLKMNGGFVPVQKSVSDNSNPKSYYRGNFWHNPVTADVTENVMSATCTLATKAPRNVPRQIGSLAGVEDSKGYTSAVHTLFYLHVVDGVENPLQKDLDYNDTTMFGFADGYNASIAQHSPYGNLWNHTEYCDISACNWVPIYAEGADGLEPTDVYSRGSKKGYSADFLNNLMHYLANTGFVVNGSIGKINIVPQRNFITHKMKLNIPNFPLAKYALQTLYQNQTDLWKCVPKNDYNPGQFIKGGIVRLSSLNDKKKYTNQNICKSMTSSKCKAQHSFSYCCMPITKDTTVMDSSGAGDGPTDYYDMAVYAYDSKHPSYASATGHTEVIRPQLWADGTSNLRHAAPTYASAAFANAKEVSQSAACDCGSITARYAVLEMPWDELANFYSNQEWVRNNKNNSLTTVLSEMSYGWAKPIGDVRNELPVGLYIPSTPKFGANFSIHERDFLYPANSSVSVKELSNKTYIDTGAPLSHYLQEELLFKASNATKTKYMWNVHTFKYGACMRWPYGQVARMEMSPELQQTFYPAKECTDNNCYIKESALIGYCENFNSDVNGPPQYAHCARDAYTQAGRLSLCDSPRTKFVVVAKTLGIRSIAQACNLITKVCLLIPGEPNLGLSNVLTNLDDASGFTIMVTPFNWSVANGLMASGRGRYLVGATSDMQIHTFSDDNTNMTGMAALDSNEFNTFLNPDTILNTETSINGIVAKLDASYKAATKTFDLPFVYDMASITNATLYPGMTDVGIYITAPHITIRSALPNSNLHFNMPDNQPGSCVRFFVTAPYFNLSSAVIDQEKCDTRQVPLEQTPVVFGGSDVTFATIDITVYNSNSNAIAVAFAGHYTSRFLLATTVNASFTNIIVSDNSVVTYVLAAARAVGTLRLTAKVNATVVIQPIVENTFVINTTTPVDTIDISKYTSIYGSTIMRAEYPLMIPHESLHLILFGTLAAVNLLSALILAKRAYVRRLLHPIKH